MASGPKFPVFHVRLASQRANRLLVYSNVRDGRNGDSFYVENRKVFFLNQFLEYESGETYIGRTTLVYNFSQYSGQQMTTIVDQFLVNAFVERHHILIASIVDVFDFRFNRM